MLLAGAVVTLWMARENPAHFTLLLTPYVSVATLVAVYLLCGKRIRWRVLAAVMVLEAALLIFVFPSLALVVREFVGAGELIRSSAMPVRFIGYFIAAGLLEEFFKLVPVLALIALDRVRRFPQDDTWAVREPLDAIVCAVAAATAFTVMETWQVASTQAADLPAMQQAVLRAVSHPLTHAAWSGLFGYYVGLGVLYPAWRVRYCAGAYLAASLLHAAYNASTHLVYWVPTLMASVTIFSAVILHARRISPTRDQNFATGYIKRVGAGMQTAPARQTAPVSGAAAPSRARLRGRRDLAGVEFEVSTGWRVIGRDPAVAELVLAQGHAAVSRQHCVVRCDATGRTLEIRDLGSRNGTFAAEGLPLAEGRTYRFEAGQELHLANPRLALEFVASGDEPGAPR